jgi:hypothetical protein
MPATGSESVRPHRCALAASRSRGSTTKEKQKKNKKNILRTSCIPRLYNKRKKKNKKNILRTSCIPFPRLYNKRKPKKE